MSTFEWRRRETRHFGEQWYPFAEVKLLTDGRRWRSFAFQVDTGAVISVLRRSAADHLGIQFDHGEPIELGGVGGPSRRYFVHRVRSQIAGLQPFEMRIAFAETEDVPNLLGRLDFFDRYRIEFDPSVRRTQIALP